MTNEEIAARLVAITALRKELAAMEAEVRDAACVALKATQREPVEVEGVTVGCVTRKRPTATVTVTDEEALIRWVGEVAPHNIVTDECRCNCGHTHEGRPRISPKYRTNLLEEAEHNGALVDLRTGEALPFVKVTQKPGGVMVRTEGFAWEMIRDSLDWNQVIGSRSPKEIT